MVPEPIKTQNDGWRQQQLFFIAKANWNLNFYKSAVNSLSIPKLNVQI